MFCMFFTCRSDGKEIIVDNKFLKVNNPLMVIIFLSLDLYPVPVIVL